MATLTLLSLAACARPSATPTPTLAAAPDPANADTPDTMHTPTPDLNETGQYIIFDHAYRESLICFSLADDTFTMPNVTPATNGIDEWTIREGEPPADVDGFRMPVLPDGVCAPFDP